MGTHKRVLMIVYGFIPDDPRVITEARTLSQLGYSITAIGVGFPNSCSGDYSRDGIQILVTPVVSRISGIPLGLVNLIRGKIPEQPTPAPKIPASNPISLTFYFLWVMRLAMQMPLSIVHAHEHQSMPVGWLLAKLKQVPWIYDAHEHVPGNRSQYQTLKARGAIRVESFLLRHADAVITVGSRLKQSLEQRGAKNVVLIGNWKKLESFAVTPEKLALLRQRYNLSRFTLTVVYFGVLSEERQIDTLIDAIRTLPDIGLLIAGRGELRDDVTRAAQSHPQIIWLDWLPYDDVAAYTMLGDVIYYCLKEVSDNVQYSTPNKLFDAFAAGKAMIASRGIGEIGEVLETEEAALLLDEVTPDNVKAALESLRDDAHLLNTLQNNAIAASEKYNWDVAEQRLHHLYLEMMS